MHFKNLTQNPQKGLFDWLDVGTSELSECKRREQKLQRKRAESFQAYSPPVEGHSTISRAPKLSETHVSPTEIPATSLVNSGLTLDRPRAYSLGEPQNSLPFSNQVIKNLSSPQGF